MSDNHAERERVSRLIRALAQKTTDNGATEAEAMAAAEKMGELMAAYGLTMTDAEHQAEPVAIDEVDSAYAGTAPVDYCQRGISAYCGVKMWSMIRGGGQVRKIRILGQKADSEMAAWLYLMLQATLEADCKVYQKTPAWRDLPTPSKRTATTSFFLGMSNRINERLLKMAAERAGTAKTGSGTALVVVKNALVEEAYAKLNLRFGRGGGLSVRSGAGYAAGQAAGDRVNLSRPVGGSNHKRLLASLGPRIAGVEAGAVTEAMNKQTGKELRHDRVERRPISRHTGRC